MFREDLKAGIRREFIRKFGQRGAAQFFRPLLYQLSYLGGERNSIGFAREFRTRHVRFGTDVGLMV
jgi:hypothetical protein